MHKNSLKTNDCIEKDGSKLNRRVMVYNVYNYEIPLSDREVMIILGFNDMNSVRPRITELIQEGVLEECGTVKDSDGKPQRLVRKSGAPLTDVKKRKSITSEMKDFLQSYEFRHAFCINQKSELLLQQIQQENRKDLWHDYVEELSNTAKQYQKEYEQECANDFGPF